jgi:hypothetical protein
MLHQQNLVMYKSCISNYQGNKQIKYSVGSEIVVTQLKALEDQGVVGGM